MLDLSNQYDKSTQLAVISNPVDQLNALLTLHKALCRMRHGFLAIMMSELFFRAQYLTEFRSSTFALVLCDPIAIQ